MLKKGWIRITLIVLALLASWWVWNRVAAPEFSARRENAQFVAGEAAPEGVFLSAAVEVDTDDSDLFGLAASPLTLGSPSELLITEPSSLTSAGDFSALRRPLYLLHCAWRHHLPA